MLKLRKGEMVNEASTNPRIVHSGTTEERIRCPGGLVAHDTIDRSALPGRHLPSHLYRCQIIRKYNVVLAFDIMYRNKDEWYRFPQSLDLQNNDKMTILGI